MAQSACSQAHHSWPQARHTALAVRVDTGASGIFHPVQHHALSQLFQREVVRLPPQRVRILAHHVPCFALFRVSGHMQEFVYHGYFCIGAVDVLLDAEGGHFVLARPRITLAVTATAGAGVKIPGEGKTVRIVNEGPNIAFVAVGGPNATATLPTTGV